MTWQSKEPRNWQSWYWPIHLRIYSFYWEIIILLYGKCRVMCIICQFITSNRQFQVKIININVWISFSPRVLVSHLHHLPRGFESVIILYILDGQLHIVNYTCPKAYYLETSLCCSYLYCLLKVNHLQPCMHSFMLEYFEVMYPFMF